MMMMMMMDDAEMQAINEMNSLELVVSLLYLPVPVITLVVLGTRCYREGTFRQSLPLLASQFNSALIWGCMAA
jgi:hypothetical protein